MIIKLTFAESDFICYLQDFCENLKERMFHYSTYPELTAPQEKNYKNRMDYLAACIENDKKQDEMNKKRKTLLSPYNKYKKGSDEYKEICSEVLRLWQIFSKGTNMEGETPNISIQYSLKEKDENGEVVYYFSLSNACVVM